MQNDFGGVSYPAEYAITQDEKTWGIIAHVSGIITGLFGLGFLGPLIVWLLKKDQSRFVGYNAFQALIFQAGLLITIVILMIAGFLLICIFIGFLFIALGALMGLAGMIYSILGAVRAGEGKYFEYPLTGAFARAQYK